MSPRRHQQKKRISASTTAAAVVSVVVLLTAAAANAAAFVPSTTTTASKTTRRRIPAPFPSSASTTASSSSSSSALFAIGVLAKKAKQADLRKYVQDGVEEDVMAVYKQMKAKLEKSDDDGELDLQNQKVGPLQESLTRRKGTITVIAEYKRTMSDKSGGGDRISDVFEPDLLSPQFREYGASAIAVMADERMGGCTYQDLKAFVEEQRRARTEVPGPLPVINNDLIVDELQIARTAAYGADACVLTYGVVVSGGEGGELVNLLKASKAAGLETIVAISSRDEAQGAIDAGARMICVVNAVDGVDAKVEAIADLQVPEGQQVCTIASILARSDNQLQEVEEAWAIRDKGFNAAWVGEALYKAGMDAIEHPGSIIRSMKSKSSLKWASPKAYSGRGEGAREYLGDIMM